MTTGTKRIVLTSANSFTAGLLIPQLRSKGYHTTGLIRKPAVIAADEVITDWMHSDKAKQALANADYIIHLSGEINSKKEEGYIQSNLVTTQIVADAAKAGRVKRIIFLSYPDADPDHKNLYLRYKGKAEKLLSGIQTASVIFRCPVIIDSPDKPSRIDTLFISQNGKAVPAIGNGSQKMHPVYRGDVVNMIIAALEKGDAGTYELSGCEEMTTNEFIRLVNGKDNVKIAHTPAWLARLLSRFVKGLSPTFVDIMLHHTNSMYLPETYQKFGVAASSLTQLWSVRRQPDPTI